MSQAQQTTQLVNPTGNKLEQTENEVCPIATPPVSVKFSEKLIYSKPVKMIERLQTQLPKTDDDPFIPLLEIRKEKDKARCEAWKDEVQNLLIFVSLVLISRLKTNIRMIQGRSILSSRHCFHY